MAAAIASASCPEPADRRADISGFRAARFTTVTQASTWIGQTWPESPAVPGIMPWSTRRTVDWACRGPVSAVSWPTRCSSSISSTPPTA
ncbi:hypothetical protein [Amycolatopsis saalfeldensis]|uniref:hypothetical protein n=1 Tax=Amycolatopsis saalfeldensis TaxID=394193 RepID=UPI000B8092F0|nr:hypothetical protein [Amycolatopsis saalfeldensis]